MSGNITEKAPDTMIRQILGTCGPVISWKRVKAFGFCELAGPDAGLRAVRLLHDLMVGEKRLVAKVDAKTKTVLDEYKGETICLNVRYVIRIALMLDQSSNTIFNVNRSCTVFLTSVIYLMFN